MTDPKTISVYDAMADEYDTSFSQANPDKHLRAFLDRLPKNAHVLDLGCGPARAAAFMIEEGHTVDAVDASDSFVAAARARGVPARKATFDEIGGTDVYDAVWANFSLLHASREAFARYLTVLALALKPGGVLHLGMKLGVGEGRDSLGRFYTYYTEDELRDLLKNTGLEIVDVDNGEGPGLAGNVEPWTIMVANA